MSLHIDFLSSCLTFLLDKFILFGETLGLLLSDLLLSELSMIVIFFTHTIQVMFHCFLLPTDFINSCELLLSEVLVSYKHLLLLFLSTFLLQCLLLLKSSLALSLIALLHQKLVIILLLKLLQLSRLLLGLFYLSHRSDLLVLQHPDTVT